MGGFANSVVGGAETLIRSAIRSANYVAGLAGWRIGKDGSAELNSATIRGSLIAGGGNVTVDSTGLKIVGSGHDYEINSGAGFLARNIPDDGSFGQMVDSALFLTTATPTPANGLTLDPGFVVTTLANAAGVETPQLIIQTTGIHGKQSTQILMKAQSSSSAVDNGSTVIEGGSSSITIQGRTSGVNNNGSITLDTGGGSGSIITVFGQFTITGNDGCNPVEFFDGSVVTGTTVSTTFDDAISGAAVAGVAFIAPKTGGVHIFMQCGAFNSGLNNFCLADFQVRNGSSVGSGSIFRAADENSAAQFRTGTTNQSGQLMSQGYVAGLTPGNSYNATIAYRVTAGTGTFNRRKITVHPNLVSF